MQIDQQVKTQESTLHRQYNEQLMSLQQQAAQQKAALEQQAMHLTLEYQQKASEEEMRFKMFEMQQHQYDAQRKMAEQVREVKAKAMCPPLTGTNVSIQSQEEPDSPVSSPVSPKVSKKSSKVPKAAPVLVAGPVAVVTNPSYVPPPAVAVPHVAPPTTYTMPSQGSYVPPPTMTTTTFAAPQSATPYTSYMAPTCVAPSYPSYSSYYAAPATTIIR
jgi:hypothetical protein